MKLFKKAAKVIVTRATSKTPEFWRKVQKIGLVAAGIAGAIYAAPAALPAAVITAAGYLATIGGTAAALSQLTVEDK
jgi:hypothetical protein